MGLPCLTCLAVDLRGCTCESWNRACSPRGACCTLQVRLHGVRR